jgi:hypothetical protein
MTEEQMWARRKALADALGEMIEAVPPASRGKLYKPLNLVEHFAKNGVMALYLLERFSREAWEAGFDALGCNDQVEDLLTYTTASEPYVATEAKDNR